MADHRGTLTPTPGVDQVSTLDVGPTPTPHPTGPTGPRGGVRPGPNPTGPGASAANPHPTGDPTDPVVGVGTEGELDVWEGRFSMRNFLGRVAVLGIVSLAWAALAVYAWGYDHTGLGLPTTLAAIVLALLWLGLGWRMVRAHLGYKYRLTTRRLFVASGIFHRKTDQLELLRVQDVFNHQPTLLDRLLNVGSVVIVSDQKTMPNYVLAGVADPKGVMDLVWHHARAEQDQRNVRVEQI
jgi:Bacterial PH domain